VFRAQESVQPGVLHQLECPQASIGMIVLRYLKTIQIFTRKCGALRPVEQEEMNSWIGQLVKAVAHKVQT
jgi:hypothetical protein